VSREEAEQRRGFEPDVPPANRAKIRSILFDDLLDAKMREFNPRYAEADGALLGQFRHLHTDISGHRELVGHLGSPGRDAPTTEQMFGLGCRNAHVMHLGLHTMNNTFIEAELPAELAAQARAFVAEGWATDFNDLLAEALRRFLESHEASLTESFIKEDVEWGLRGRD
jgi:hypothetical protein